MTPREQSEAAFAALAALPWVRTADRLPLSPYTNGQWLVLIGPDPAEPDPPGAWRIAPGTGSIAAKIAFAHFTESGWTQPKPDSFGMGPPILGEVVAWLDLGHWHLDRLADQLREPPR